MTSTDLDTTDRPVRRISWLLPQGSPLLGAHDPFLAMLFAEQFEELTDLEPFSAEFTYEVVTSPLAAIPMPISYPRPDGDRGRFTGLNPAAAACPLFWLPDDLRHPYIYTGADGEVHSEGIEEWQARVGLELTASGVYDEDEGWIDPLATYLGLDADDPEVQKRVTAYLDGEHDPELDSLPARLAAVIADSPEHREDEYWAVPVSIDAPDVVRVNRYAYASVLLRHLAEHGEELGGGTPLPADELAVAISGAAASLLTDLDDRIPLSDGTEEPVGDYLQKLFDQADAGTDPQSTLASLEAVLARLEASGRQRYPDEEVLRTAAER